MASTMAPFKSKVDELQEALKLPWLPFDMSQPNNGTNMTNLVHHIYVSCKLMPSYEDFAKERSSELELILRRRPTAVPKIKITIENEASNECSNESDLVKTSQSTSDPVFVEINDIIPNCRKKKKFFIRSVRRILNNSRRTYKALTPSLKKIYRRSKIVHCVVSLVRLKDDKYLKLLNERYTKLSPTIESHQNVPETTSTVAEDNNEKMDTSIDPVTQPNLITSETTKPIEISESEKTETELVIEKTTDPSDKKSVELTKTDSSKVNIMNNERLNSPKTLTVTNNLDKLETKDDQPRVEITSEPKTLFISTEVEFTKKPVEEKPLSDTNDQKPSLPEINIIKSSPLKNVDTTPKTISKNIDLNPCNINDLDIKPSISEINIKTISKEVEQKICNTNLEVRPSLPEINIMKTTPLKNVDIIKTISKNISTNDSERPSLPEINIMKSSTIKSISKDVELNPCDTDDFKPSLPEINISKSLPSKNVDISLNIAKKVELNVYDTNDVDIKPSLSEINIIKTLNVEQCTNDLEVKPSISEIIIRPLKNVDILKTFKDVEKKPSDTNDLERPSLPEINIIKSSTIKSISKDIELNPCDTDDFKPSLPEINISKSLTSKNVDISLKTISKDVELKPCDTNLVVKPSLPEINIVKSSPLKNVEQKPCDTKDLEVKTSLPEINIIKTSPLKNLGTSLKIVLKDIEQKPCVDKNDLEIKPSLPEINIMKNPSLKNVDITLKSVSKDVTNEKVEISLTKSPTSIYPSLPGIDISRKPIVSPKPEVDLRRKSEVLDSLNNVTKTVVSKEVNIIKKSPDPRLPEINIIKSDVSNQKVDLIKTSISKEVNITKNPSPSFDGSKTLNEIDDRTNKEPKASITRILKEVDIETKSPDSVHKSKHIKDRTTHRCKSSSEERKTTSSDSERSSPDLSKLESISETSTKVSLKNKSKDEISSEDASKLKTSKSHETLKQNDDKNSSEETSKEFKKSKSSSEERKINNEKSKIDVKEPKASITCTSKEVNIEKTSTNPVQKSKNKKYRRDSRSLSIERKSTSSDSERASPNLSKLDTISETHVSKRLSLKRKSKNEISSDVKEDKTSKLKRRKSHENSKHTEDKTRKQSPELTSKEAGKTRTSQERDSSKKSESNTHKSEKISNNRRHSSKSEHDKEHRKSTEERRKHRNSKDKEIEPEKKKQRIESKSTENVLDDKQEDTIQSVSPQTNEITETKVTKVVQDTQENIKRRRESNSQIVKQPADLKRVEFTSYSCSKCATELSSHNEWVNHHCKSSL